MALAIIEPPVTMPVSLADAKEHCAVDGSAMDGQMSRLIAAVTSWLAGPQGWLGRSLCDQTLEWTCGPEYGPVLPRPPFIALQAVHYFDEESETEIPLVEMRWRYGDTGLVLAEPKGGWDRTRARRIRYRAGYGTSLDPANAVDPGLQHAILVMVARLLENREALNGSGATDLFGPWIVWGPR